MSSVRDTKKRPKYEIADIIKIYGDEYRQRGGVPGHHLKVLTAIERCRTAALGGHINVCTDCGSSKISYNSCRNRHCPKCGGLARELWIEDRKNDLLPARYQHIAFTIPHELNDFCRYNQKYGYDLLFHAAWKTLKIFGEDPQWVGGKVGATMILHTWGQALTLHPHVHCIVPSDGLKDEEWVHPKKGKRALTRVRSKDRGAGFLFPVKAMAKVFRSIYLTDFRRTWLAGKLKVPPSITKMGTNPLVWCRHRWRQNWIVYAKAPFRNTETVVEYLGRYSHKTAISSHRLIDVGLEKVAFSYKDYRTEGKRKVMKLDGLEFLRRFCLHILRPGFVRIRHYGIHANTLKTKALRAARKSLGVAIPTTKPKLSRKDRILKLIEANLGRGINDCPDCGALGTLVKILLPPNCRAPPPIKFNTAGV